MCQGDLMARKKYLLKINTSRIMKDTQTHFYFLTQIYRYIFSSPKASVKDKLVLVILGKSKKTARFIEMRLVEFLLHLNVWRLNVIFNIPIQRDDFYQFHPLTKEKYEMILDMLFRKFIKHVDNDRLSSVVSDVNQYMVHLSISYSNIAANTFSLYDTIEFERRSPIFKKLIHTKLDYKVPIKETEMFLDRAKNTLSNEITKDKKSNLYPYVRAKRFSLIQLVQMFVAVGYRTDVDKTIMPKPIAGNFLKGLRKPSEMFMESKTSLISLLAKHEHVPKSGYLSQKINLASLNTQIDYNKNDCGTQHLITIPVESRSVLKIIEGKYMMTNSGLVPIKMSDEHLIGKDVQIRSYITCCHTKRHHVCKTCVGVKSDRLKGTRIGGLPAPKFASPIFQITMSTKHKMESDSMSVDNDVLNLICTIDSNDIYLKPEYAVKGNYLLVDSNLIDDLSSVDYKDDDSLDSSISLDRLDFIIQGQKFSAENEGASFDLNTGLLDYKRYFQINPENEEEYMIPLNRIIDDEKGTILANITIITSEISRFLKMIESKLDGRGLREYTNYADLIQDIIEISVLVGTSVKLIHIEALLYNLIRDANDILERPNFKLKNPKYQIITITNSILKGDLYTGFCFQYLRRQFIDPDFFRKKSDGLFGIFFRIRNNPYF